MNPIEHAWDRLKKTVYGLLDPPTTLRDIRRIAVEWNNLGQQCLDELVDSMPRWIRHASMQEDVLLGIRGTGVYCNLDHNF